MKRLSLFLIVLAGLAAAAYYFHRPVMKTFIALAGNRGQSGGAQSCDFDGKSYALADQRRANDGCNVCTCGGTGWTCSKLSCPANSAGFGSISGTLGTPTGSIPAQRVCAINLKDDQVYCQQTIKDEDIFVVPAPAGEYWVYATLAQDDSNRRAYYSEFELCGEKAECKDHSPVAVTVASEQIAKADPKDWQASGQIDEINVTPSKWEYSVHNYYPSSSSFVVSGRDLARVKLLSTPWPPQEKPVPSPIGDATLSATGSDFQTWTLPIANGFQASAVYAIGTTGSGDYMKSRELKFVRPIQDASSTVE